MFMSSWAKLFVLVFFSAATHAADNSATYYLKWDTDHTERSIRPEYKISAGEIRNHPAYQIALDAHNRPVSIKFFLYGTPSDGSSFGAHEMRFTYTSAAIHRHYFRVDGTQVRSAADIYQETYPIGSDSHYTARLHYDENGNRITDRYGVFEYRILKRDKRGRRTIIRHMDRDGQVIPDRFNKFLETRFTFDKNDRVTRRISYDLDGKPALGEQGYHIAFFQFDALGNFLKEEFLDLSGQLVIPSDITFAKIEFLKHDQFGRIGEIRYYDATNKLRQQLPAISKLTYDSKGRLTKRSYHHPNMDLTNNDSGAAIYHYSYTKDSNVRSRKAYDADGNELN
jgi:hypothetical protein